MSSGTSKVLVVLSSLLAIVVLIAWAFYVYVIPAGMGMAVNVFPKEWEVKLGKQFKESFLQSEKVNTDKTIAINKFYDNINIESGYDIHVTVVDSKVKNAFALPGGEIVVYSKIIDDMNSYEELVALLGHETGHVYYRHSLKSMFTTLANYLIVSAIFGDFTGVAAIIVDNAQNLRQLSYSRELETESDIFAYKVMQDNNINPKGMVDLFNNLKKQDTEDLNLGTEMPEFLLTHPKLETRIEEIKAKIEKDSKNTFTQNDSLKLYFEKVKTRNAKSDW